VELHTPRLLMRSFVDEDLDAFAAMMQDADVLEFFDSGPLDRAAAWRQLALFRGNEALRGYSQLALIDMVTGRFVGRAGPWWPEGWPGLEVGWALAREAWGRGYATEAGAACRDHAFRVLGADDLISLIHPENVRSVAAVRRIGHSYRGTGDVKGTSAQIRGQRPA
jgi:RimJ/RimL family protein N-acetyltransferase